MRVSAAGGARASALTRELPGGADSAIRMSVCRSVKHHEGCTTRERARAQYRAARQPCCA